ncbi:MAG TPA: PfkB family carbohydrate kinase [Clostridia bacterium]|nr:PfkB family carbohydrate kinase [Clostridia bacterium]
MGYVAGVGALNADFIGKSRADPVLRDSNPGYVRINAGGVTRNILENLARMGLDCRLLTAVGRDALGDMALDATREAGVDVSRALRVSGEPTSTYCALLEPSGEMFAALSDMRILERLDDAYLDAHAALLSGADVVALDPSLPERAIDRVLELARGAPVFADPVSTSYAKKLLGRVGRFSMLKPNRMELEVLSRMRADTEAALRASAEKLVAEGCRAVYVTLGADGCAFADARGRYLRMKMRPVEHMQNATGAGDAFAAGALYGFVKRYAPERTLALALAAGRAAILSPGTVEPRVGESFLDSILAENPVASC